MEGRFLLIYNSVLLQTILLNMYNNDIKVFEKVDKQLRAAAEAKMKRKLEVDNENEVKESA